MRDCISVMMTFISLDIFFGHAIQTNCLLLPGFGLRSVTLRLTRPTRPSARGERLTRPLSRNSARHSSAQPTAAARRACSFRRRRQLAGGKVATSPRSRTTRPVWRRHGRRSSGPPTPLSRGRAAGAAARLGDARDALSTRRTGPFFRDWVVFFDEKS